jgi:lysophospholipase L1-like esterase
MATFRICFVGDSITVGSGDTNFLGWPGRLSVAETERGHDVTLYNMGVRGDTSEMIVPRWRSECDVRLPDHVNGRLVLSFGLNDTAEESGVGIRVPLEQSLANARAIIGEARGWLPTLMVGPIPLIEDMQPYIFPNGIAYHYTNARVAEVNAGIAKLCTELDVPYLNVFDALVADPAWEKSQRDCDGVHATGDGYQIIADMVAGWPAWRDWFAE